MADSSRVLLSIYRVSHTAREQMNAVFLLFAAIVGARVGGSVLYGHQSDIKNNDPITRQWNHCWYRDS